MHGVRDFRKFWRFHTVVVMMNFSSMGEFPLYSCSAGRRPRFSAQKAPGPHNTCFQRLRVFLGFWRMSFAHPRGEQTSRSSSWPHLSYRLRTLCRRLRSRNVVHNIIFHPDPIFPLLALLSPPSRVSFRPTYSPTFLFRTITILTPFALDALVLAPISWPQPLKSPGKEDR